MSFFLDFSVQTANLHIPSKTGQTDLCSLFTILPCTDIAISKCKGAFVIQCDDLDNRYIILYIGIKTSGTEQ